jgi:hypothetical protein
MMSVGESIQNGHYCKEHNIRFFKNEKVDQNGSNSIWYSHKKNDGTGFCVEKDGKVSSIETTTKNYDGVVVKQTSSYHSMYTCNAMNNAVNLACNGAIEVNQIGKYFKKILTELNNVSA